MIYDIRMEIEYSYDRPAASGRNLLRLMPADLPLEQRLIAGSLTIEPQPREWLGGSDFFQNVTNEVVFDTPHKTTLFSVQARVERMLRGGWLDMSPRLDLLEREVADYRELDPWAPHHFLGTSPRIAFDPEMEAYGIEATANAATAFDAVEALGQALHRDMTFDAEATTVDTPASEAFANRHGVCQDFTHIMITCLRSLGMPAGYVSGFLRTVPPEGQPRLEGADAMHAWVRAWCGHEMGWVEYDPTNAVHVSMDHVVIARGRDYSDVAPVKGVSRSSGAHTTRQSVDVDVLD
ncbi:MULTISPECIES: transglutaminase family protein [Actibacterium]|uniref:Transglutaminase-like putative cysteine protease n=1 Tax=Actibacterium naphthalenivorans TaxID=1614693 RepID=A0A840C5V5_9RHOB|nr:MULTISPECIES: transglutaminase family protein [Actibacterium]ALG89519.1 transglutaminase [Actibacterium sp. EMB200-NS6]MBB4020835.1 transglutaminase-like putative cysteine protease [Actibacterium naphthalenivorans]